MITTLYKYLFGLLVAAYVITVVGIPVYFHYCGGELEKINYVMKSSGCCDGDEEQEEENGCCRDEGKLLLNNQDFTIKDNDRLASVYSIAQLVCITPLTFNFLSATLSSKHKPDHPSPPLVKRATSITVLRI